MFTTQAACGFAATWPLPARKIEGPARSAYTVPSGSGERAAWFAPSLCSHTTSQTEEFMPVLEIKNLHANIAGTDKQILKGVDLTMEKGSIHAIMGKNGSGKSTLCQVIAGRETYEVTGGDILFNGQSILEMSAEERAREGVFLAFQYPVEIPGVSTSYFLKAAVNAIRQHRGEPELDAVAFIKLVKEKQTMLGIKESFMNRAVNEGFSGGEKKRNEVFQLAVVNPLLGLLDETDSGLDIDALKVVAEGINKLHEQDAERSWLVVTHYQRLLNYIVPDIVHVMIDGRIVKTGDKNLALQLEEQGYDWVEKELSVGV
jgi:Fe-S cluster assembly ATP-binding protein